MPGEVNGFSRSHAASGGPTRCDEPGGGAFSTLSIGVVRDVGGNRALVRLRRQRARLGVIRNIVDRVVWPVWRMGVGEHGEVLVGLHRATGIGQHSPLARGVRDCGVKWSLFCPGSGGPGSTFALRPAAGWGRRDHR